MYVYSDRELVLGGKVVVKSSFIPPVMKELLRKVSAVYGRLQYLSEQYTPDYMPHRVCETRTSPGSNFLRMLTYAWVPLQYVLETLEHVVFPAEVKVLSLLSIHIIYAVVAVH